MAGWGLRWAGLAAALALAACDDGAADGGEPEADATVADATATPDTVEPEPDAATTEPEPDTVVTEDTTVADAAGANDGADAAPSFTGPGADALLALMQEDDPQRYANAVAAGATFHTSENGQTFYGFWAPAGFDPDVDGVVVSIGGHDTFACADVVVWKPFLEPRRYALIAIQWWYGTGEATTDYMTPDEMLPILREALDAQGIPRGHALLHGFSRGAANTYAVTAIDRATPGDRAFLMTLANAGGMMPAYPPNQAIIDGDYGPAPLEGSHWILFCGGEDPDPQQSGCPAMHATASWLASERAIVDRFIEDPAASHGGLHLVPKNAGAALDAYAARLADPP